MSEVWRCERDSGALAGMPGPGTAEARHRIFGPEANLGLLLLTKHPLQAVPLAQKYCGVSRNRREPITTHTHNRDALLVKCLESAAQSKLPKLRKKTQTKEIWKDDKVLNELLE